MYINHDDIVALASANDNQDQLLANIDREIVSLLSQVRIGILQYICMSINFLLFFSFKFEFLFCIILSYIIIYNNFYHIQLTSMVHISNISLLSKLQWRIN